MKTWSKEEMAKEVANFFQDGMAVNLGIGLPSLVAQYIPNHLNVFIHSENGVLGVSGRPRKKTLSPTLINAGKETIRIKKGSSFFHSSLSFGMIRGSHVDCCVLGGMEVDAQGNLANWMIPGKKLTGMGGAMDLVHGAKNIIVMMTHKNKEGQAKLVKQTSLPLTGKEVVNFIVTDLGVFKPKNGKFEIIKTCDPSISKNDLLESDLIY